MSIFNNFYVRMLVNILAVALVVSIGSILVAVFKLGFTIEWGSLFNILAGVTMGFSLCAMQIPNMTSKSKEVK